MNKLSFLITRVIVLITLISYTVSCQPDITPRPVADFTLERVSGSAGKIKLTNKSLHSERYQWTFGDGRASTEESPEIEYTTDGTYTITLTAKNGVGQDQVSNSVDITGLVKIAVAAFDFTFVNGSPNRVQFTNKSTNADRYQWLFGDGQSSTDASPLIEFKSNGVVSAQLTARNGNSADVITKSVYISEIPTTGSIMFWTNGSGDGSDIEVYVANAMQGLVNTYQSSGTPTTCGQEGNVTYRNVEGTYGYYARSKSRTWSGTVTIKNGECRTKLLPQ